MTLIDCLDLKARIDAEPDPAKKAALEAEYGNQCALYGSVPGVNKIVGGYIQANPNG